MGHIFMVQIEHKDLLDSQVLEDGIGMMTRNVEKKNYEHIGNISFVYRNVIKLSTIRIVQHEI
jgi:hypothetical protein